VTSRCSLLRNMLEPWSTIGTDPGVPLVQTLEYHWCRPWSTIGADPGVPLVQTLEYHWYRPWSTIGTDSVATGLQIPEFVKVQHEWIFLPRHLLICLACCLPQAKRILRPYPRNTVTIFIDKFPATLFCFHLSVYVPSWRNACVRYPVAGPPRGDKWGNLPQAPDKQGP
jgi:hypothetical protein